MSAKRPAFVWGFQSPEVTEIYAHLSESEKKHLKRLLTKHGIILGVSVTAVSLVLRYGFHIQHKAFVADTLWSMLLSFVIGLLWLPWTNRAMRAFFTATAYAKSRNWPILHLYSFSRRPLPKDPPAMG